MPDIMGEHFRITGRITHYGLFISHTLSRLPARCESTLNEKMITSIPHSNKHYLLIKYNSHFIIKKKLNEANSKRFSSDALHKIKLTSISYFFDQL